MIIRKLFGGGIAAATLLSAGVLALPLSAQAAPAAAQASGTSYYVDCLAADNGDGTEAKPFNSFTAANAQAAKLKAGDQLLFKRGTTCTGENQTIDGVKGVKAALRLVGVKGTAEAPIVVGDYGDAAQPAPVLAGDGVADVVLLRNSEYVTVQNLDVTNKDEKAADQYKYMRRGIVAENDNAGELHGIVIQNNTVHDILGEGKKDLGGSTAIQLENYGRSIPVDGADKTQSSIKTDTSRHTRSWFNDVRIVGNTITNVNRSGINMSSDFRCREDVAWECGVTGSLRDQYLWTPNLNLYIAGNTLKDIGGDGIVVQMSNGAIVEKNYLENAASRNNANNAGIWNWNSDNTLFQYNEVANTQKISNNDGTAWDFDYGTRNTVFQYNYSHDNAGGATLVCACTDWYKQWSDQDGKDALRIGTATGGTFRYNLSVNDGVAADPADGSSDARRTFTLDGITDMNVYNNTVVLPKGDDVTFSSNAQNGGVTYNNNVIIAQDGTSLTDQNAKTDDDGFRISYGNNLYVGGDKVKWAKADADGNTHVALADYLAATGVDLDAVAKGDLSSLYADKATAYAAGKGRAAATDGLPFTIENKYLDTALAGSSVDFPHGFDSVARQYGAQVKVSGWSAPAVGAFQGADTTETGAVADLAAGASATIDAPGNATLKIAATTTGDAQLGAAVANDRGYTQTTSGKAGAKTLFVRTSSDAAKLTLTNTGTTGSVTGITVTTVQDQLWDGSFESVLNSESANSQPWNGISPWAPANRDHSKNRDTYKASRYMRYRSDLDQKDAVVTGGRAAKLGKQDGVSFTQIDQRNIPAQPGKTYRLGFWATTGDSTDSGDPSTITATVRYRKEGSGAGGGFGQYATQLLSKSVDAKTAKAGEKLYVSGTFTVPEDAAPEGALWVNIGQNDLKDGSFVYIDDVTLTEDDAAEANKPTPPATDVPATDKVPTYTKFEAIADPGSKDKNYFQPLWYAKDSDDSTTGHHIQAHGGQVVPVQENGQTVYYWYGEDRSSGYYNSHGVHVYRSTDGMNWVDKGVAMRSIYYDGELADDSYFTDLYGLKKADGTFDEAKAKKIAFYLNTNTDEDGDGVKDTANAIFERPKVLYNAKTGKYVMWWHADGSPTVASTSNYARSLAAVAVSDSPTGPFKLTGAFRLPNREDYTTGHKAAVPGGSRDMTVFQDDDGTAYLVYSSEENRTLYIAKLNDDYTNVVKTTKDTSKVKDIDLQYSENGEYPYTLADGGEGAPVAGQDFVIVKDRGMLEAPAMFKTNGKYYIIASGATGWAPNKQTYYTSDSVFGSWIRGVKADDQYENTNFANLPEGADGLLSVGDTRGTTFGSQTASVFQIQPGKFVYIGDRWNSGKSDSTYVWLPITIDKTTGALTMQNPATQDPATYGDGWDVGYWERSADNPLNLASITVDGKAIDGFNGGTTSYTVDTGVWGKVPTVKAVAANAADTTVSVDANIARAIITVASKTDPAKTRVYTVRYTSTTEGAKAVSDPWKTTSWGNAGAFAQGETDGLFRITDASNTGAWTNKDNLTTIYQPAKLGVGDSIETTIVSSQAGNNEDPRAGIIVRNDLSASGRGTAHGYALLVASLKGSYFQTDSDNNGYIDKESAKATDAVTSVDTPIALKLVRNSATEIEGFYRLAGASASEWKSLGTATLGSDAADKLDVGVFATSNNGRGDYTAIFDGTTVTAKGEPEPEQPTVTGITVDASAVKTDYTVGDTFSAAGLKVAKTLSDGKTADVAEDGYTLTGADPDGKAVDLTKPFAEALAGRKVTVTVALKDDATKTASFEVSVKAKAVTPEQATVTSIAVTRKPAKTEYTVGDAFDPAGLEVTATLSDKTTRVLTADEYLLTGFSSAKAADAVTVTVTYTGKDAGKNLKPVTFTVKVKAQPSGEGGNGGNAGSGDSGNAGSGSGNGSASANGNAGNSGNAASTANGAGSGLSATGSAVALAAGVTALLALAAAALFAVRRRD